MTSEQFDILATGLREVAPQIPLNWGHRQNNKYDNELKRVCNIYAVMTLADLENYIAGFDDDHKQYYRRRWYMLRCADCDEFLFYVNEGVEHNPVRFDKEWDIRINGRYSFDVKGTVIPRSLRNNYTEVIDDPSGMIKFFYDEQSTGVRYDMQNRLFVVHHSLVAPEREFYLRCAWGSKRAVYKKFVDNIDNIRFHTYKGCTSGVIFILEEERNKVRTIIDGLQ